VGKEKHLCSAFPIVIGFGTFFQQMNEETGKVFLRGVQRKVNGK